MLMASIIDNLNDFIVINYNLVRLV